jgi:ABC-type phosphate transport system substrate-binding protein
MKLTTVAAAAAVVVAFAGASSAHSSSEPTANVENIATVIIGGIATDFEFNLYDCPAGEPMAVEWQAQQPSGNNVSIGVQPVGTSSGANAQHLTLTAGGDFVAGERWVGSGTVFCGAAAIPVSGSGTTKSLNGV